MSVILCYGVSFIIYISILLWGLFGKHNNEYFGYCLFSFYLIMPSVSFLSALILGITKSFWKWIYPLCFGSLGFIIPIIVFSKTIQTPLYLYFLPSAIGLAIGIILKKGVI